jgi:hypothetical protein
MPSATASFNSSPGRRRRYRYPGLKGSQLERLRQACASYGHAGRLWSRSFRACMDDSFLVGRSQPVPESLPLQQLGHKCRGSRRAFRLS